MAAPLREAVSPNKHTALIQNDDKSYDFIDIQSREKIGHIFETDQDISNVQFVASWNDDSSKVALLMYYGTKLSCILIFKRNSKGDYIELPFKEPDPVKLYHESHDSDPFPENASGYSNNSVGRWITGDTVELFSGETKDNLQKGTLIVIYDARIKDNSVSIVNVRLLNLMDDASAEKFLQKHGALN